MRYLIYAFLATVALRFILNLSRYVQSRYFFERYKGYITATEGFNLIQHRSQIVQLFRGAGTTDSRVPHVNFVGYGLVQTGQASVFENIGNTRQDIASTILICFEDSIGTYRRRMWESLNPLFWIVFVFNLPKNVLSYLGVPPESTVTKIAQLFWWLASAIVGFIISIYKPDIDVIVRNWITEILRKIFG